ncbi:hypothetical protein HK096_011379 [Nowakowskiella sp. JEL0078]|nr:hypothetical protein HK096_011379 [Nowakowskiella sp. JEL0078]
MQLKDKWGIIYSGNDASWMAWATWIVSKYQHPDFPEQINKVPPPPIFDLFTARREPADIRLASQRSSLVGANQFAQHAKRKLDQVLDEFEIIKESVIRFESRLLSFKQFLQDSIDSFEEVALVQNITDNSLSTDLFEGIRHQEDIDHINI